MQKKTQLSATFATPKKNSAGQVVTAGFNQQMFNLQDALTIPTVGKALNVLVTAAGLKQPALTSTFVTRVFLTSVTLKICHTLNASTVKEESANQVGSAFSPALHHPILS